LAARGIFHLVEKVSGWERKMGTYKMIKAGRRDNAEFTHHAVSLVLAVHLSKGKHPLLILGLRGR
jgi:hypothetical protein